MPTKGAGGLLSVADALSGVLSPLTPLAVETIPTTQSIGRVLAETAVSGLDMPAADLSSMDGYAVRAADCLTAGTRLTRIGESAAGHPFSGTIGQGETIRIFTGAYLPAGADAIILQEDVIATAESDGATITITEPATAERFIRPVGLDAKKGAPLLPAGTRITARAMALLLAAGQIDVTVRRKPVIGILSTGDELVPPGLPLAPGQITSSNAAYLMAFVVASGGTPVDLGIAKDRPGAALYAIRNTPQPLDFIVTTGGASIGTHDHIATDLNTKNPKDSGANESGTILGFWKIAMRPGKPLISGAIDGIPLLGLPGNPVSSAICALVFLRPAIATMTGDITTATAKDALIPAELAHDLPPNDKRQDYLRAIITYRPGAIPLVTPAAKQDSSMIGVLATANALLVRPPFDPARTTGDTVSIMLYPDTL